MSFSELLKQCRKKQGVSQAELASRLGVTQQAVGKWESGSTRILNPGVALYSVACEEGEGFVVDDYMLVKLGSDFTPDEGHATGSSSSSDATASPAPAQTADTTTAPQTSDAPSGSSSFPVVPVVIAAVAVVAVIVVVIIIVSKKKKKAE